MDRTGIVPRIVQSWWAPGRVVRSLRGLPDRVLVVVLMAAMLLSGLTEGFAGPGAALTLTRAVAGLGFLVIWGAGLRALAGKA